MRVTWSVASIRMTVRLMVILTTPPRNAAAPAEINRMSHSPFFSSCSPMVFKTSQTSDCKPQSAADSTKANVSNHVCGGRQGAGKCGRTGTSQAQAKNTDQYNPTHHHHPLPPPPPPPPPPVRIKPKSVLPISAYVPRLTSIPTHCTRISATRRPKAWSGRGRGREGTGGRGKGREIGSIGG